jgi:hypothetical protein
MAGLAKSKNAKDCGDLTVLPLGYVSGITKQTITNTYTAVLDEIETEVEFRQKAWIGAEEDATRVAVHQRLEALTADRLALLTELRDCELLEEKEEHQDWCKLTGELEYSSCGCWKDHNTLARAIKAHLDELIKQRKKNPKDICEKCMKLV